MNFYNYNENTFDTNKKQVNFILFILIITFTLSPHSILMASTDMENQMSGLASGSIAQFFSECLPGSPDTLAAAAAGNMYINGEDKTTSDFKGDQQDILNSGDENNTQKENMRKLKDSLLSEKESLEKKLAFQTAVADGYKSAAGLSIAGNLELEEKNKSLNRKFDECIKVAKEESVTISGIEELREEIKSLESMVLEEKESTAHSNEMLSQLDRIVNVEVSVNGDVQKTTKCANVANKIKTEYANDYELSLNSCSEALTTLNSIIKNHKYAQTHLLNDDDKYFFGLDIFLLPLTFSYLNLLTPSAHAEGDGSVDVNNNLGLNDENGQNYSETRGENVKNIDRYMSTYLKRAAIFNSMSGEAETASLGTQNSIAAIDERIDQVDEILAELGGEDEEHCIERSSNISGGGGGGKGVVGDFNQATNGLSPTRENLSEVAKNLRSMDYDAAVFLQDSYYGKNQPFDKLLINGRVYDVLVVEQSPKKWNHAPLPIPWCSD